MPALNQSVNKPRSGYSLVELIISISIMLVLVGGGLAAYREFDARQSLVNGGRDLASNLRVAQKKAQAGEKPNSPECINDTLESWRVFNQTGSTTAYSIRAICGGQVSSTPTQDFTLPQDVEISSGDFSLDFAVLSGKLSSSQTIILAKNSEVFSVQVTSAGGINEQ